MNGYILLMEPVTLYFRTAPSCMFPQGDRSLPVLTKEASIHLLLIIKPEGHHISEKVMAILEKGILTGATSRLYLFESHRQ